mmetsp:Transcript_17209/g.38929  ORF Transcript_17209/g.38929 Transcript_17209/m.38929 type:complete len:188 (+) Transcript_17209:36-599(+)
MGNGKAPAKAAMADGDIGCIECEPAVDAAKPPEPEPTVAAAGGGKMYDEDAGADCTGGEEPEFELWVETDIEASWCLGEPELEARTWRDNCSTATLRRRWDEFEALGKTNSSAGTSTSVNEALELLGVPEDADAQQIASAFRHRSKACHPDKAGCADDFNSLVSAYQAAQQALATRAPARPMVRSVR